MYAVVAAVLTAILYRAVASMPDDADHNDLAVVKEHIGRNGPAALADGGGELRSAGDLGLVAVRITGGGAALILDNNVAGQINVVSSEAGSE
jgi:hypothetical protein